MQKLYVYADESGRGRAPFIVAIVIVDDQRESLENLCLQIERESRKGFIKWSKANYEYRIAYMRAILSEAGFREMLYFVIFDQVKNYDTATVDALIRAIEQMNISSDQRLAIFVDGLDVTRQREYATQLRQHITASITVRGVPRDASTSLIRLADALAGFVSDAEEENSEEVVTLYERARRHGMLIRA